MMKFKPSLLLQEVRSGLVELEFYGFIVHLSSDGVFKTIGETNNYPFFQRSCAKPLHASLIADYGTVDFYSLTSEEIAVCCASHTGEKIHTDILKNLLKKGDLSEKDLLCPIIPPLNRAEGETVFTPLHNNCSGKHTLMLLLCLQNGWDLKTYLAPEHPLQIAVRDQINSLCQRQNKMPMTLDGCTAPNWATSLEEMTLGFLNLFTDKKYTTIQKAFRNHPYLIGGAKRLDTQIIQMNQKLAAKVGANGLCIVVNTESKEALSFKIMDADMHARSVIVIETLIKLGWLNVNSIDKNLLECFLKKDVTTENGIKTGEYKTVYNSGLH